MMMKVALSGAILASYHQMQMANARIIAGTETTSAKVLFSNLGVTDTSTFPAAKDKANADITTTMPYWTI